MCMAGFPILGEKGVGFGIMVVCSLTISWISIALCFLHAPSACGIQTAHLSQNEANLEKQFICFTTYISGAIIGFHVKCISYKLVSLWAPKVSFAGGDIPADECKSFESEEMENYKQALQDLVRAVSIAHAQGKTLGDY